MRARWSQARSVGTPAASGKQPALRGGCGEQGRVKGFRVFVPDVALLDRQPPR